MKWGYFSVFLCIKCHNNKKGGEVICQDEAIQASLKAGSCVTLVAWKALHCWANMRNSGPHCKSPCCSHHVASSRLLGLLWQKKHNSGIPMRLEHYN